MAAEPKNAPEPKPESKSPPSPTKKVVAASFILPPFVVGKGGITGVALDVLKHTQALKVEQIHFTPAGVEFAYGEHTYIVPFSNIKIISIEG